MKKINKKTLTVSLAIIAAVCVIFGIVLLLAAAAYALLFFTSRAEDVPSAVCTAALWQDTLSLHQA